MSSCLHVFMSSYFPLGSVFIVFIVFILGGATMPVDSSKIDLVALIEQRAGIRFGKPNGTGEKRTQKGPCPFCKTGRDRFAVFVNDTPQHFKCGIHGNGCGRYGDAVTFLREYEGLDFYAACEELGVDPGSEYVRSEKNNTPSKHLNPPGEQWQERAEALIQQAQKRLWSPLGATALEYLRGRGFTDKTIRLAQLGYIPFKDAEKTYFYRELRTAWGLSERDEKGKSWQYLYEGILIPWYVGGQLWKLNVRRLTGLAPDNTHKYLPIMGSVDALYNADALSLDKPAILCESEFDALAGMQACQDINVAFVATGSTSKARDALWIERINKATYTLIAFDDDEEKNGKRAGDEGALYWRGVLPRSLQILPWEHDVNDMLKAGVPLQEWVTLEMAGYEAIQTSKQLQASLPVSEPAPAPVKAVPAHDGTLIPIERGYTLTDHIARLKAQADEQELTGPSELEQAIMNKLRGYGLFMEKRCSCGCRLKWHMAGGMLTVCARCEPGGLWSRQAIGMLDRIA